MKNRIIIAISNKRKQKKIENRRNVSQKFINSIPFRLRLLYNTFTQKSLNEYN